MTLRNGRHLKAARIMAGLTQVQLADAAGLHPNSVKRWEGYSRRIGGHAVGLMVEALELYGVHFGEEHSEGRSVAVLRG
jgi:transcriptional regulator with XRE-family HTH domain